MASAWRCTHELLFDANELLQFFARKSSKNCLPSFLGDVPDVIHVVRIGNGFAHIELFLNDLIEPVV